MSEFICTVSGNSAETTKPNTIRIINDRHNLPSLGKPYQLPNQGGGWGYLLESRRGLPCEIGDEARERGSISPEIGEGNRQASSSDGRDSRLTFPLRVKIAVAGGSALLVGSAWLIWYLVELARTASHLSGLPWIVGFFLAYVIACVLIYPMLRISAISDRRAAEMGGGK